MASDKAVWEWLENIVSPVFVLWMSLLTNTHVVQMGVLFCQRHSS
jgi:hypothetical protein